MIGSRNPDDRLTQSVAGLGHGRAVGDDSMILDRRLHIVTGKGGVGKSTVSVALALAVARRKGRVLLVEADTKRRTTGTLARFFQVPEARNRILPVAPGVDLLSMDADLALRAYVVDKTRLGAVYHTLIRSTAFQKSFDFVPGIKELMILYTIYLFEESRDRQGAGKRYGSIIFDAPPTGHGLFFLRLPQKVIDILRIGPLIKDALRVKTLLEDPNRCLLHIVTIPEEMPVNETIELARDVREQLQVKPGGIFINKIPLFRLSDDDEERLLDPGGSEAVSAELERSFSPAEANVLVQAAVTAIRRRRVTAAHLARLKRNPWRFIEIPLMPPGLVNTEVAEAVSALIEAHLDKGVS